MVSILLPISNTENPKLIDRCLRSLAKQTYKDFEVLIVTSKNSAKKISQITKKYPFVKIFEKDLGKSAARNFAAQKAKGDYLLHLDADMKLEPTVLAELNQKASRDAQAVIIPYVGEEKVNFWGRCRKLEKELILNNLILETPLFLKKSLFNRIGGYNEIFDPLDDWGLRMALEQKHLKFERIKSAIVVFRSPTLRQVFLRLYHRGQALPILQEKYPDLPLASLKEKIKMYQQKWPLLCRSPLTAAGLFFLKLIDLLAFFIGKYYPLHLYALKKTAATYDKKRLGSNYALYKHWAECNLLLTLLGQNPGKILEVGCGTGRITAELVKKGYRIVATDPSRAMLEEFKKKKFLPPPLKVDGRQLPFRINQFKTVVALRVLWHLPIDEQSQLIAKISQIASRFIILDILNAQRLLATLIASPLTYPVTSKDFARLCRKNGLKIKKMIPLDVSLPVWLNLLPPRLATKTFPFVFRLDLALAKIISPGRYLLQLEKKTA